MRNNLDMYGQPKNVSLSLEEAKRLKALTESQIKALINGFETSTGLSVDSVKLLKMNQISCEYSREVCIVLR